MKSKDKLMKLFPIIIFTAFIGASCAASVGPYGASFAIAPPLPTVVELGDNPYYTRGSYHYYYNNDHWYYSHARNGPWRNLPRNHYPREVRFRGRHHYWH